MVADTLKVVKKCDSIELDIYKNTPSEIEDEILTEKELLQKYGKNDHSEKSICSKVKKKLSFNCKLTFFNLVFSIIISLRCFYFFHA